MLPVSTPLKPRTDIHPVLRISNEDSIPVEIYTCHDLSGVYAFINPPKNEDTVNISPGIRDIDGSFIEANDIVLIDSVPYILEFMAYTFMFEPIRHNVKDPITIQTAIGHDIKIIDRNFSKHHIDTIFLRLKDKTRTDIPNIAIKQILLKEESIIEETDRWVYVTMDPDRSDYRMASTYKTAEGNYIYDGSIIHYNDVIYHVSFKYGYFIATDTNTGKIDLIIEMIDPDTLTIPNSISIN